jgi:pimeloyl-ACP methyl ester carboxylesterase
MNALWREATDRKASDALMVMLPGAQGQPHDFVSRGFVDALKRASPGTGAVLAGSPMAHFADGSWAERLDESVLQVARQRGYSQIWLLGISLGGMAALALGARGLLPLAGIVALAPYLGLRSLLAEIQAEGGAQAWALGASAAHRTGDANDLARELWAWMGGPTPSLSVYLGYGRDDRFAQSHAALAALLPAERVSTVEGGHDWSAYLSLWTQWLARGLLPGRTRTSIPQRDE